MAKQKKSDDCGREDLTATAFDAGTVREDLHSRNLTASASPSPPPILKKPSPEKPLKPRASSGGSKAKIKAATK